MSLLHTACPLMPFSKGHGASQAEAIRSDAYLKSETRLPTKVTQKIYHLGAPPRPTNSGLREGLGHRLLFHCSWVGDTPKFITIYHVQQSFRIIYLM